MFDLARPDVAPALEAPLAQLEHAFRRVQKLTAEMPQDELEYRGPDGTLNSAAMLIAHMALVDLGYLHEIKGEPIPDELEAAYGPWEDENGQIPLVTGRSAAELLGRYQRVLNMVTDYLLPMPVEEAHRPVTIPWWPEPATVRYVLWHMAAHSMQHQGQISRLKASFAKA